MQSPRLAPDNDIAPTFTAPAKGALILLLPPPQTQGMEKGENMMGAQLDAQIRSAGYRAETLPRAEYDRAWSQETAAVGGIFDGNTGALRPEAFTTAMASLAKKLCEEKKCALMIRQRLVARNATLMGYWAEWDGARQMIRLSNESGMDYRFSGSTAALSVELLALTGRGGFAFRQIGGATLPFATNVVEKKSELRRDLFDSDAEIAGGVRIALAPLTTP
ncbi:MAG: hypothetical protein QM803_21360 [Rhodocyclaceae bacterium]